MYITDQKSIWCHEISAGKQTSDYTVLNVEEEPNKKKDKTFKKKQQETTPNLATLQVRKK